MSSTHVATRFASALSRHHEAESATREVIHALLGQLRGPVDLLVCFVSVHHAESIKRLTHTLRKALEPRVLIAATAGGVIGINHEIEDAPGLSVLAANLPGSQFVPVVARPDQREGDAMDVDALLGPVHAAGMVPRGLVLLGDPYSVPMHRVLPELNRALPGVPVAGGLCSGAHGPGQVRLRLDDQLLSGGLVGFAVGGAVHVKTTLSQGCRPVGQLMQLTSVADREVMEIDDRPAVLAINAVLNAVSEADRDQMRLQGALVGRVMPGREGQATLGRDDFIIRQLVNFDLESGSITVADPDLQAGQTIQLHVRDQDTARQDLELLLEAQKLYGNRGGGLLFTCNGRGTRLFNWPHADANTIHEALGEMPLAGCFAAGEIGPVGAVNHLHGHTASLLVLRPDEAQPT